MIEPDEPTPTIRARRPTWLLVLLGLVAGAAVGLAAAALVGGDDGDDRTSMSLVPALTLRPPDQAEVTEQLLDAWRAYRGGTFVVELDARRTSTTGEPLQYTRVLVQEPGRRLSVQGASSSYDTAEQSVDCEPAGDQNRCLPGPGVDFAAELDAELAAWRSALDGDDSPYAIAAPAAGCFELQLVTAIASPPYGQRARLCFDAATGALVEREVTFESGTDAEVATSVRPTPTEADWARGAAVGG
jgi:hypothetical protein